MCVLMIAAPNQSVPTHLPVVLPMQMSQRSCLASLRSKGERSGLEVWMGPSYAPLQLPLPSIVLLWTPAYSELSHSVDDRVVLEMHNLWLHLPQECRFAELCLVMT